MSQWHGISIWKLGKGNILEINNWGIAKGFAVFASTHHNTKNHHLGPLMKHTLIVQILIKISITHSESKWGLPTHGFPVLLTGHGSFIIVC